MPIQFACSTCKIVLETADDEAGKNMVCKICNAVVLIPAHTSSDPSPGIPIPAVSEVEPVGAVSSNNSPAPSEPVSAVMPLVGAMIPSPQTSTLPEPKVYEWSGGGNSLPEAGLELEDHRPTPTQVRRTSSIPRKRRHSNKRLRFLIVLTSLLFIAACILVPAALERIRLYQIQREKTGK
jgi:hypothetical protein